MVDPDTLQVSHRGVQQAGELFDPLTNGSTVGAPLDVEFLSGQGVRLNSLGSRVTYSLSQSFPEGEFSVMATGLNSNSAGDSTKLFSMQQGTTDLTTNPYRATIEKRDKGTVTFRFIAGDVNARADGERSTCSSTHLPCIFGSSPGGTGLRG